VGFFKDVRKLSKMGREAGASMPDPAQMMASMQAQMAGVTQQMTAATEVAAAVAADGIDGTATVMSATQTGALVNYNPAVQLELLVTVPGGPPYPVSLQTVVQQIQLARVQPGATIPVRVARSDRSLVTIDWARPL
jgi:hypothetical protein